MDREDNLACLRGKHNSPLINFYAHKLWKIIKNEGNPNMTSLVLMLGIGAMTQNLTFLSLELAPSAQLPGSDAPAPRPNKPCGGTKALRVTLKRREQFQLPPRADCQLLKTSHLFILFKAILLTFYTICTISLSFYIFTNRKESSFEEKTYSEGL